MRNSDIDVVGAGRVRKAKSFSFDCTRSIFPLRTRDNQIQSMNVPIAK